MKPSIFACLRVGGFAAACGLAAAAQAQNNPPATGAQAGRTLAQQGFPARGVAACASCHGAQGEGNAAAGFPRLAGQSSVYLARQLLSYAQGGRDNPVMSPIAKSLSPEERTAVSVYYAGLPPAEAASGGQAPGNAPGNVERGRTLATVGDETLMVQGCANCHGPGGVGEAPDYPLLAGQHAGYLAAALEAFKNGSRNNDPSGQMSIIAKRLSSEDIAALAAYFSRQPVSVGAAAQAAEARALRQQAISGTSGPLRRTQQGGTGGEAGVGTEGGAPTTGGGQGPGGGGATRQDSTGGPPK